MGNVSETSMYLLETRSAQDAKQMNLVRTSESLYHNPPQDQFVHIWRYEGGYKAIDENMKFLQDNKDYNLIMKDMSPLLRSRESELYLQFSFWPEVALRYLVQQKDSIMISKHSTCLLSK